MGQSDFTTSLAVVSQSGFGLTSPIGLLYIPSHNWLFASQGSSHRVTVFDVSEITNGEPAIHVLGQTDFTSSSSSQTQSGLNQSRGLAYDSDNQYLFIGQQSGKRVTVYDLSDGITDGEPAINVLGQTNFTNTISTVSNIGGSSVWGVEFDNLNDRLFVNHYQGHRILVYDLSDGITNGEPAINVLGQTLYTTSVAGTNQSSFSSPNYSRFDSTNNRLLVSDTANNRIMVFDTATINNAENAVDLLGQYDGTSFTNPVPMYTKGGTNDGPNIFGFNSPYGIEIDTVYNRLFVSDLNNHRVLVFNLNNDKTLQDKIPDYVLGQPNFFSNTPQRNQNGLDQPIGLAFDSENNRLFVSEFNNHRVMVFDVNEITNGEDAVNVLGQSDFTSTVTSPTQINLKSPRSVKYDSENNRLFVAELNHRVLVFDVNEITNGEPAVNVLGQSDFNTNVTTTSQSGMNNPRGVEFDSENNRLFVGDSANNRVLVFDLSDGITNGEAAINVLGQDNFDNSVGVINQSGMSGNLGIEFDNINNRLFVSNASRLLVYDLSDGITNGELAMNILGQPNFEDNTARTNQSGFNVTREAEYDQFNNYLYVVDNGNQRIMIFDLTDIPVVNTGANDLVTKTSVVLYGEIIEIGGLNSTQRGFHYGKTTNYGETISEIGSYETGIYSLNISNLDCGTDYHYRSFSTNPAGTGYGEDNTFTTSNCPSTGTSLSNRIQNLENMGKTQEAEELKKEFPDQFNNTPTTTEEKLTSIPLKLSTNKLIKYNTKSNDVKLIQIYLNTHGYPLASSGVGSLGKETTFFGKLTKQAVMKFQKANGLRVDGIVGKKTIEKMK